MRVVLSLFFLFSMSSVLAQVVWTDPPFPSADDQVTLYYDASQGNGELDGIIPVYIHTGLITSQSSTPTDWQYVNMPWASTDPEWVMAYEGTNLWSYDFGGQTLADFFGMGPGVEAEQLAMVFRNGPARWSAGTQTAATSICPSVQVVSRLFSSSLRSPVRWWWPAPPLPCPPRPRNLPT